MNGPAFNLLRSKKSGIFKSLILRFAHSGSLRGMTFIFRQMRETIVFEGFAGTPFTPF
jgi:hypothetical protein